MATHKVLIMGASYGSLLASKLLFGGHEVTLICLPAEVEAINADGIRVRMPIKGRSAPVEINSRRLPGKVTAAGPAGIDPSDYDLVALAMQEPQYRSPGVRELLDAVAKSGKPCMSIMNMPPLPYLKRIRGLNTDGLHHCFTDASVWANFDPGRLTLCSPDPQAIRMPDDKINVLTVTLPTNFKAARFDSEESTNIMRQFQREIEAIRFDAGDATIDLPVKLKVHEFDLRAAGQVGHALHRQLSLREAGFGGLDQGGGARGHRGIAPRLRLGTRAVHDARRLTGRPGAVREIRSGGQRSDPPIVRRTRSVQRRTEHRTRGPAGAEYRGATRHAQCRAGCDRGTGRRQAGDEPKGGGLICRQDGTPR